MFKISNTENRTLHCTKILPEKLVNLNVKRSPLKIKASLPPSTCIVNPLLSSSSKNGIDIGLFRPRDLSVDIIVVSASDDSKLNDCKFSWRIFFWNTENDMFSAIQMERIIEIWMLYFRGISF